MDYYNMSGRKISRATAMKLFEEGNQDRCVALTLYRGVEISTVLLVINHNFNEKGRPLIFETMIFGGKHDCYQERYTTRLQAEKGHARAVELVKSSFERKWYDRWRNVFQAHRLLPRRN